MEHTDPLKEVSLYPEAYFDFDDSVIAVQEVPAAVNTVLKTRSDEGSACQKVQILSYSRGVFNALGTASEYPITAAKTISNL